MFSCRFFMGYFYQAEFWEGGGAPPIIGAQSQEYRGIGIEAGIGM